MGWIDVGPAIVRFRTGGEGPRTIAFAADPPMVIEHYDELFELLRGDFRVVVLEMPGFGFSVPKRPLAFEFRATNDLIARVLQQLAFGPYLLAFPCVSAYCAIDIAARFPDLVSGLVVIQAPSWPEQVKWKRNRDPAGLLSKPIIGQLALRVFKRKVPSRWFDTAMGRRELLPRFVETADAALANGASFCLASVFQRYLTDDAPSLPSPRQPTMVIWGEADRSHQRTDKASTCILVPGAHEVRFGKAGHFPELEEPELFAEVLRDWIRDTIGRD